MIKRKIVAVIVLVLVVGLVLVGYFYIQKKFIRPTPIIGERIPSAQIMMLDSTKVSLDSLITKKSVLILFKANCDLCKSELTNISNLYPLFKDSINIIAISISKKDKTKNLLDTLHVKMPVYLDYKKVLEKGLHVAFTPTMYFVDANKRLVRFTAGEKSVIELDEMLKTFSNARYDSTTFTRKQKKELSFPKVFMGNLSMVYVRCPINTLGMTNEPLRTFTKL